MTGYLALAGGLLSTWGVALVVLDAQSGVGREGPVGWQVAGCVVGVVCFIMIGRRARRYNRRLARDPVSFAGVLLLLPWREGSPFGIDRPLLAEVVRFVAVILVGTLVLWRAYRRDSDERPTPADLWVVLVPVFALSSCVLRFGSLPGAVATLVVTGMMLRAAGYSRGDALQLVLVPAVILALLVLPNPHSRARLAASIRDTIAARVQTPERTFVRSLIMQRQLGHKNPLPWFDLPPRAARQLAIASIVGVVGYPGAAAVVALFGVIGWVGFGHARDAAALGVRVPVTGMTAALVVPAALHIVGCLVFLNSRAGPLPFISYGPGELVLAWTTLGFVAAGERP